MHQPYWWIWIYPGGERVEGPQIQRSVHPRCPSPWSDRLVLLFSTPKTGWQWHWKKGLVTSHIQPSPVGLWRETRCSKTGPALSDSPYYRGPDCREQQSNIASNVGVDGSCLDYTMWVASRSLQFKTQFWVCPTFQMLLNGEVTGSNISIENNRK